ncbi:MAG: hypothetical protein ACLUB5_02730 [Bifidobacterium dentium]
MAAEWHRPQDGRHRTGDRVDGGHVAAANAPIRSIVPPALVPIRRPRQTGGSAVWARPRSTWASIGEFHSINDRASTGSVSPQQRLSSRVRGAHSDTARIHPVSVSTSASMPDAYKLVHASRMATARYSHCAGLPPHTRFGAGGGDDQLRRKGNVRHNASWLAWRGYHDRHATEQFAQFLRGTGRTDPHHAHTFVMAGGA